LPSIEKIVGSKSIRSLELWTLKSAQRLLRDVLRIKNLESLDLYLVPKKALGMGLENCSQLANLKHFKLQPIIKGFSEKRFKGEDTHYPLSWLSESKKLERLVLRNLISETEALDLLKCTHFNYLELINIEELKTIILPESVSTISIQGSNQISIRFANIPKKLKQIIIGDNVTFEGIEGFENLPALKSLSVTKLADKLLQTMLNQSNLVSLHLYDVENFQLDLSRLNSLRFLKVSTSDIEKIVTETISIPNLQELEIWFNGVTEVSVQSFDPLKGHPTLKSVKVFPANKNQEIASALGLHSDYISKEVEFLSSLNHI
jgi:hypothetical protein